MHVGMHDVLQKKYCITYSMQQELFLHSNIAVEFADKGVHDLINSKPQDG
jgi:hypothetical protein